MSGYGLTYRLTMCNPKIYASKHVAISMFMSIFKFWTYDQHYVPMLYYWVPNVYDCGRWNWLRLFIDMQDVDPSTSFK